MSSDEEMPDRDEEHDDEEETRKKDKKKKDKKEKKSKKDKQGKKEKKERKKEKKEKKEKKRKEKEEKKKKNKEIEEESEEDGEDEDVVIVPDPDDYTEYADFSVATDNVPLTRDEIASDDVELWVISAPKDKKFKLKNVLDGQGYKTDAIYKDGEDEYELAESDKTFVNIFPSGGSLSVGKPFAKSLVLRKKVAEETELEIQPVKKEIHRKEGLKIRYFPSGSAESTSVFQEEEDLPKPKIKVAEPIRRENPLKDWLQARTLSQPRPTDKPVQAGESPMKHKKFGKEEFQVNKPKRTVFAPTDEDAATPKTPQKKIAEKKKVQAAEKPKVEKAKVQAGETPGKKKATIVKTPTAPSEKRKAAVVATPSTERPSKKAKTK
eukprot:TRINITY_DN2018_c0_g1_i3.p1 TRINITY_DN2018_c0_g1~~TRINITY_DN2018_c0_g1_i3.p1  ORF type:complete len:379 (+),score=148.16 TRINITY_DN2018_c0_g1_i3:113-1249(+)